jgi:hypothetical protein
MDRTEWNLHTAETVITKEREKNLQIDSLKIGYALPEHSGLQKLYKLHKFQLFN